MIRKAIFITTILAFGLTAQGDSIDLSSWSASALNFAGGQPAGSWSLGAGNTSVTQTVNADPSFFLNNQDQTKYSMDGSWQVITSSDNDYMGFVFGYQNSSNFYLFDWKQGNQGYAGSTAIEGMTIKKMTGGTGNGLADLSLGEFWENNASKGDMTVLAQNHGSDKGWVNNRLYDFHLDYNLTDGDIAITVKDGATTLWDTSIYDTTFTHGEFGFYNFSQAQVRYAGFEQTGGENVPVPGAFLLGSIGLGFATWRLKRRKTA